MAAGKRHACPTGDQARRRGDFWRRWKPAWQVKFKKANRWRINYDLHRASGLWLWLLLLVFAWSSVGLNLGDEVYKPVMKLFAAFKDPYAELPNLKLDKPQPGIPWREAHRIGQAHMAARAEQHGFSALREDSLSYDPHRGPYRYRVQRDRDITERWGSTMVFFDANPGDLTYLNLPTGPAAGNTFTNWLCALHFGAVFGLPYRIFVCFFGLIVVVLLPASSSGSKNAGPPA